MQDMIAAKFDPPMWMGDQISRDILLHRLDAVLTHRLTLVHAPAGYGKTSLLSQWRDRQAAGVAQIAWLTLERDDSDMKRFVKYLLLDICRNRDGSDARAMSSELPPRAALSAIINELAARDVQVVFLVASVHQALSAGIGRAWG